MEQSTAAGHARVTYPWRRVAQRDANLPELVWFRALVKRTVLAVARA